MIKKFLKIWSAPLFLMALTAISISEAAGAPSAEISAVLGGETYVMKRVEAMSGEKYEDPDDPETMFWINGDESVLTIEGKAYTRYVLLREASEEGKLMLTADGRNYILRQVLTASGAKYEESGNPETYFWSKGASAMLRIDGKDYEGYDYWLPFDEIWFAGQDIPADIEWKAVSIDGTDVIAGSDITVTFHADGKMSGIASVNNYTAPWFAYGNRIIISNGVTTRKAGLPDMMEQEDKFLEFLPGVVRFVILKDGLRLINKNGGEIVLTRR
ncbi:MAG: MliC family protein [Synergistaceae bacterium]|jgi:heat shock protein HslJ/membrane-bound inhibitor of C-type lysozyme|nr:MliC family protein [Synergistaceae bacterium]